MYSLFTPKAGFTLVELLVVIALLLMFSALLFQGLVGYGQLQQHRQVTNDIKAVMQTARQQSQTLTADDAYGMSVSMTNVALFAQSATSTALRTVSIPTAYMVTAAFSTGQPYVTFARRSGVPSATGSVSVFDTRRQATTTITVLPSGLVE